MERHENTALLKRTDIRGKNMQKLQSQLNDSFLILATSTSKLLFICQINKPIVCLT